METGHLDPGAGDRDSTALVLENHGLGLLAGKPSRRHPPAVDDHVVVLPGVLELLLAAVGLAAPSGHRRLDLPLTLGLVQSDEVGHRLPGSTRDDRGHGVVFDQHLRHVPELVEDLESRLTVRRVEVVGNDREAGQPSVTTAAAPLRALDGERTAPVRRHQHPRWAVL